VSWIHSCNLENSNACLRFMSYVLVFFVTTEMRKMQHSCSDVDLLLRCFLSGSVLPSGLVHFFLFFVELYASSGVTC
jgi:hypothetical protein